MENPLSSELEHWGARATVLSGKRKGKPSGPRGPAKVAFRQDWSIGKASAEADDDLLRQCFIDNGIAAQLRNTEDNASIVLGRVGIGKSAILNYIEQHENNVVRIDPTLFSIKYICNSNALQFVSALGVKLDPIFQALWKHVLCVEYIRLRYNIKSESDARGVWAKISTTFSFNEAKRRAYDYFKQFGGVDFWKTTEVRLREIDKLLENQLTANLSIPQEVINAGAAGTRRLTERERIEVVTNAKSVIDGIQMSSLQQVIKSLAEIEDGSSYNKYYIIIDDLDTEWADSDVRHRLIRALIETIRRFRPIRNLKIIIAMRTDLMQSVITATKDAGLQAEKLEDFYARVTWTESELKSLVEKRVNVALRNKYTRSHVEFQDIFPREVRQKSTWDYILERTLRRPRDLIIFVNECFKVASGRVDMTPTLVQDAYRNYSAGRKVSLLEEWNDIYPDLSIHLDFLAGFRSRLKIMDISTAHFNQFMFRYIGRDVSVDPITRAMNELAEGHGDIYSLHDALPTIRVLLESLYQVGAIGFVFPPVHNVRWVGNQMDHLSASAIDLATVIVVHPMLHDTLGINASADKPS